MENESWRAALARELDRTGYLRGRFVQSPDAADTLVPAERYFDRDYLRWAIAQTVPALRGRARVQERSMRVAVSRFSRRYASLLSAASLVGMANGIVPDVSPANCTIVIRPSGQYHLLLDPAAGVTRCAQRPARWPVRGPTVATVEELRATLCRTLYAGHLAPIYALALQLVPVAPRLVWSSAAEWVGIVADHMERCLGGAAAGPYLADRDALLGAAALPGIPAPNPLRDRIFWEPAERHGCAAPVQTRRHCCLTFVLEDRLGELCENCPHLPLEDRVTLLRNKGTDARAPEAIAAQRRVMLRARELPAVARAIRAHDGGVGKA